jgi:hypothetical protein
MPRRLVLAATLPFVLALAACRGAPEEAPAIAGVMDRAVAPPALADVPLQVAVHDLIEVAGSDVSIRVCRGLADRRVSVAASPPRPLRDVLDDLAAQTGGALILAQTPSDERALPTIRCAESGAADYFVIGN